MLDYFNTRQQQSNKSPILRKPQISYGISIQSPQDFQKPHSLICQSTFVNPYLSYDKNRKITIPDQKLKNIDPKWTKKIDLNQIQTQKSFIRINNQFTQLTPQNRYKKQLSETKTRFRLTKGQFTNYLERNSSIKLFGPLQGRQRNKNKSILTRKQLHQKSQMKLTQDMERLTQYRSRLFETKQPFEQKHMLQKNRFAFRQGHKKQLEQRKQRKLDLYALPQLLNKNSSHFNNTSRFILETESPVGEEIDNRMQMTLLSNKSREKLNDLRDFNFTQRYFTIDAKCHRDKARSERETVY